MPIAFDSLSVVVNPSNTFVECLTVAELKKMWEPAAEGKVTTLEPDPIRAFPLSRSRSSGTAAEHGTFDYFTLAVVGVESSSRSDYTKNEDDAVLVDGIAADPNALGYFGYAYYLANQDKLKLVAIDNGHGCVVPSAQTVADNSYQPLSRPIFVYVSTSAAARPEAKAFARFYVDPDNASYVRDVGYVPLPPATLLAADRRLDTRRDRLDLRRSRLGPRRHRRYLPGRGSDQERPGPVISSVAELRHQWPTHPVHDAVVRAPRRRARSTPRPRLEGRDAPMRPSTTRRSPRCGSIGT